MSNQTHAKAHQLRQHKREEFSKDGVEQQVSFFSSEQSPVSWGLVLDRSGSMMGMMKDVYDGALHVLTRGTSRDDKTEEGIGLSE